MISPCIQAHDNLIENKSSVTETSDNLPSPFAEQGGGVNDQHPLSLSLVQIGDVTAAIPSIVQLTCKDQRYRII